MLQIGDEEGGVYSGSTKEGVPHGRGSLLFPSGIRFVGHFVDGVKEGRGTFFIPEDDEEEEGGEGPEGRRQRGPTSPTIVGELSLVAGRGDLSATGAFESLSGNFRAGELEGKGVYRRADGSQMEADFKYGSVSGPVSEFNSEGDLVFEGCLEADTGRPLGFVRCWDAFGGCYAGFMGLNGKGENGERSSESSSDCEKEGGEKEAEKDRNERESEDVAETGEEDEGPLDSSERFPNFLYVFDDLQSCLVGEFHGCRLSSGHYSRLKEPVNRLPLGPSSSSSSSSSSALGGCVRNFLVPSLSRPSSSLLSETKNLKKKKKVGDGGQGEKESRTFAENLLSLDISSVRVLITQSGEGDSFVSENQQTHTQLSSSSSSSSASASASSVSRGRGLGRGAKREREREQTGPLRIFSSKTGGGAVGFGEVAICWDPPMAGRVLGEEGEEENGKEKEKGDSAEQRGKMLERGGRSGRSQKATREKTSVDDAEVHRMGSLGEVPDLLDVSRCFVKASALPSAGEGLFARTQIPAGCVCAFYSGVRLSHKLVDTRDWKENDNTISIGSRVIDVPKPFHHLSHYSASLGHKTNHSGDPEKRNAEYSPYFHPRFGQIKCVRALRNIQAGEEILVDYGYSHTDEEGKTDLPDWYLQEEKKNENHV